MPSSSPFRRRLLCSLLVTAWAAAAPGPEDAVEYAEECHKDLLPITVDAQQRTTASSNWESGCVHRRSRRCRDSYNKVLDSPAVYLGDDCAARNVSFLRSFSVAQIISIVAEDELLPPLPTGLYVLPSSTSTPSLPPEPLQQLPVGDQSEQDLIVSVHHIELRDTASASLHLHVQEVSEILEGARAANEAVLIHCIEGQSRSVSLLLAHLLSVGSSLKDALALLKERRPCVEVSPESSLVPFLYGLLLTLCFLQQPRYQFFEQLMDMEEALTGQHTAQHADNYEPILL